MMTKKNPQELVSNRRAFHDYEILETFEAGIVLQGTEVKSLRNHGGSLQDSFIVIKGGELWLIHSHIAPYSFGNIYNHEERRDRKLLMHKQEIDKLRKLSQEKGSSLVPLSMYLKKGRIKVKVAAAKGKKAYDKRAALKEKEHKKMIEKALRNREE